MGRPTKDDFIKREECDRIAMWLLRRGILTIQRAAASGSDPATAVAICKAFDDAALDLRQGKDP